LRINKPVIEHATTAGVFSLDGQDFDVENNIWIVGDAHEVLVVDAAHDAAPIGRSYSDFPTIIESIRDRLLVLPGDTMVHTGHGESTTIGAEAPHLDEWIARGR
jgi:glyoxylase-like metal-dependent hydrolase (beta-lactamase superfamily II)